jgi:hypothetical protein
MRDPISSAVKGPSIAHLSQAGLRLEYTNPNPHQNSLRVLILDAQSRCRILHGSNRLLFMPTLLVLYSSN